MARNVNYKSLIVWNKAMDLAVKIYELEKQLPEKERFALSDQLRRSAISIPSNIAEGYGRNTDKETVQFLGFSKGSLHEVETQLILGHKIGYFSEAQIEAISPLIEEIAKMETTLIKKLKS